MCNRLHKVMKNGDAGIFPVYYNSLKHLCTENVTAVRCTLQRLQVCSRATIASSKWNEYQLIDIFYSLFTASIYCHRGRHRCDTVIHACLQPTRGLSLKADLILCVRPSGARPQHIANDYCCGYAHYLVHLLTTVAWYTACGLQSFGACTAT